jgi:hypothetical protein
MIINQPARKLSKAENKTKTIHMYIYDANEKSPGPSALASTLGPFSRAFPLSAAMPEATWPPLYPKWAKTEKCQSLNGLATWHYLIDQIRKEKVKGVELLIPSRTFYRCILYLLLKRL